MNEKKNKTKLVLVVDFDDDLGRVGIKTPVIGEVAVRKAAMEYALSNPQDADTNTLFTALKLYKEIKESKGNAEIAIIAGHEKGGFKAGIKIREELRKVIASVNADSAIVVVDSVEDEYVIPVVQSLLPIEAIERVVVEQIRGVEETYVLIGRYLRKILEEKRFSRIFLGLPGILIISYIMISITPYSSYASSATLIILGLFLILKGFGVVDGIIKIWKTSPIMRFSFVFTIIAVSITLAVTYLSLCSYNFATDAKALAHYIKDILPYAMTSFVPLLLGRFIYKLFKRSFRIWRDIMSFIILGVLYYFFNRIADLILLAPTGDLQTVVKLMNESYVLQTFILFIAAIMAVSAMLYARERRII